jgi:Tfp pilus assembly protein PilN
MVFLRWRHSRREATPEARFPVPVVYAHGLFALITVVLVLLTAHGIGGS